jgi:ubiquinone/menaquinone biosynthesis C-methylase UbiE
MRRRTQSHLFSSKWLEVCAIDHDTNAISYVRDLAKSLAPHLPASNFQLAKVEAMPFPDGHFDAVISSAVLHFADDEEHFNRMLSRCGEF